MSHPLAPFTAYLFGLLKLAMLLCFLGLLWFIGSLLPPWARWVSAGALLVAVPLHVAWLRGQRNSSKLR